MNQQEIKEVKDQMRVLADKLEALEAVETQKRKPQKGEVWQGNSSGEVILITNDQRYVQRSNGAIFDVNGFFAEAYTYLGNARDVLMLRSEVEKDYVSKEDLRKELIFCNNYRSSHYGVQNHLRGVFALNQ